MTPNASFIIASSDFMWRVPEETEHVVIEIYSPDGKLLSELPASSFVPIKPKYLFRVKVI